MSDYCRGLANIDVHVGTPSSDYPHYARAAVHFHSVGSSLWALSALGGRANNLIETSPAFSCLGSDWELTLHTTPNRDSTLTFKVVLAYLSTTNSKIEYAFQIRNTTSTFTHTTFRVGKTVEYTFPAKPHHSGHLINGALVIDVLMRPSNYPFHPLLPVNPSSCKTVRDLYNDEEFSDIVFEIGGGITIGAKKGDEESAKFYAHRMILKKAAPLLADLIGRNDSSSLVNIPNVSPRVFEVLLRYIYGCDVLDFGNDPTFTMEILDIANKYGITTLKLQAEAYMVSITEFNTQNLLEILIFAHATNCALLKEEAMLYVTENASEVVQNVAMDNFPEGLMKDVLAAMAWKETKKQAVRELSSMSVGELRLKAHAKGLDMDGSREMLISALTQHDKSDDDVVCIGS
jgi:hypothetical protein